MRTIVLYLVLLAFAVACSGNGEGGKIEPGNIENSGTPELTFSKIEHDFGSITEGEKVGTIFSFTNNGDGDLIIASAATSCGCTVPKYSKEPVPPGGTGTVEVVFDSSNREGKQTKTVTVRSNASTPVIILRISADIKTN